MDNWDDIRIFLAVARSGSVRGAALALNINHSTVSRRIAQFEDRLGTRLFEKLPSGYEITSAGQDVLALAQGMEDQAITLERRIYGRDTTLSGPLRIALPTALSTHLIMADLAQFARQYPDISLEIITSYDTVNLTKRHADVAIRLIYDQHSPPDHLYGVRLSKLYRGVYLSPSLLKEPQHQWIIKEEDEILPDWAQNHPLNMTTARYIVSDLHSQLCATEEGLGLSILPCFMADTNPKLSRAPNSQIHYYGDLWMLTHGETRKTPRVRTFTNYIKETMRQHAPLLIGKA